MEMQNELTCNVGNLFFIDKQESAEVTTQNSGKPNIEFILYVIPLFQWRRHLKNNKVANIIACNIPCNFFYIEPTIFQWKANI